MRKMKTVVDLNAGIGGRITAFFQLGYEIKEAYEIDSENVTYLTKIVGSEKVHHVNIAEIEPSTVSDADIFMFKYLQRSSSNVSRKHEEIDTNHIFCNIVAVKRPKILLIEVPYSSMYINRIFLEKFLLEFQKLGYIFSYQTYDESHVSGLPIKGKQVYFLGMSNEVGTVFDFPTLQEAKFEKLAYENEDCIDEWYRNISFDTSCMKYSKWYIKTMNVLKETTTIHMGLYRECYLVDRNGPRRFTHNELATLKGLTFSDYNRCSNKRRMYRKIAYASNVYVVRFIASALKKYFNEERNNNAEIDVFRGQNRVNSTSDSNKKIQKVLFPKLQLRRIYIEKLKGLNNVEIVLNKRLTAIMGVNGSGKSTILHALACTYSKFEKGEDYKFSYFFTPNPDALWNNSSLSITNYDENTEKETIKYYRKNDKRWADYSSRPIRDIFYFGVDSCIPEIEKEKRTSYINYTSYNDTSKNAENILKDAAYILQKDYTQLILNNSSYKIYLGVDTESGLKYSSLSMGAGEQRILKLLQTVYNAHQYSLILIDEIELLLHVDALKKLVVILSKIAENRKLQIVFTTHSLEMQNLMEYVDIRYIEHDDDNILVYESIKPELLYELSGEIKRKYIIYVEDGFAEAIVKKVLKENHMLRFISVIKYGAIENAFIIAAEKVITKENLDNILIVADGDKYVSSEEKINQIKKRWSGTESSKNDEWKRAISMITEFNLPPNTSPEKYVHSLLTDLDIDNEVIKIAKRITAIESDSHQWIGEIVKQMGDIDETYIEIMNLISNHPSWERYVEKIKKWVLEKKELCD